MATVIDPVALGIAASLARPEGNLSGLAIMSLELTSKRLQLLKEAVPRLSRVAVLWESSQPGQRAPAQRGRNRLSDPWAPLA